MKRSPAAAAWLSVLPGLGHIYLGQTMKGFAYALLAVGLIDLVDRASGLGLLIPVYWVFVMLDAHRSASEANHGVRSGGNGGSPWSGWGLIGLGILFLLFNFDLIDFDWLWRAWPIALILIGVRLIKGSGSASDENARPTVSEPTGSEAIPAGDGAENERSGDL